MPTVVDRDLSTRKARDIMRLVRELARDELAPRAATNEREGTFPRGVLDSLGAHGLLGLPFPQQYGGGGQPYGVYLQVIEELASAWLTVAESVSVHTMACFPLATSGTDEQRERWLPGMVSGSMLGAYCLSEANAGSDAAALTTRAVVNGSGPGARYIVNGTKSWITHSGHADFYNLMVRTGGPGSSGISCLLAPRDTPGLSFGPRERLMGLRGSPVAEVRLDDAAVDADRLIGREGRGFHIAMSALDSGRLGIAACAVGLAQAALNTAVSYAGGREQFGRSISEFQGVSFMLADMGTGVAAGRALYLEAARRKDAGLRFSRYSAMAKLFCTDMAMRVTADAVQVLGGVGYTEDFPVERYMREAKVLQIFEGTNQIQRVVIAKDLTTRRT
ncbi:acyl-CoA dehydrogenase family protein [Actinomycetes bacterium KLBMP 9759]